MQEAEFDKFADEYRQLHAQNIGASGEGPEFFAEYKVKDVAELLGRRSDPVREILDFGSGVGTSIPWFRKYFAQSTLTCLDVSEKSLAIGRERYGDEADFLHFDGATIPREQGSFDLAFAACVFHHIPEQHHVPLLREVHRVLRPGGTFVVFEHNPLNPLTVRAVNTCPFDENAVLIRRGVFSARMEEAGFAQRDERYRIFFPGFLGALRGLEPALAWLPLGAQYFVAGTKPS